MASGNTSCTPNVGGSLVADLPPRVPQIDFGGSARVDCDSTHGTSIGAWQVDRPYDLRVNARARVIDGLDPRRTDPRIIEHFARWRPHAPAEIVAAIDCFFERLAELRPGDIGDERGK